MHSVASVKLTRGIPQFPILGVRVHALQIADVITLVERWIQERMSGHYIAVTGMHGLSEGLRDPGLRAILNAPECLLVAVACLWYGSAAITGFLWLVAFTGRN